MSYELEARETIDNGIKRIAYEQVDKALAHLMDADDRDEAVHEARKHFKKIRALLRLVRDEIGEDVYKRENVCYRDAGRRLADVRDTFVQLETLDDLVDHFAEKLVENAFSDLRQQLVDRHEQVKCRLLDEEDAMAEVAATIQEARTRVTTWPIEDDDFSALRGGLKRVYKRGRKRLDDAYADPVAANFHEWRKRVKYLWYHTRILKPVWTDVLDEVADAIHDLSDYLGDEHDLAGLRAVLLKEIGMDSREKETQVLLGLIDQRRAELQALAHPLGRRLYVEKPAAFVDRIAAYWSIWDDEVA